MKKKIRIFALLLVVAMLLSAFAYAHEETDSAKIHLTGETLSEADDVQAIGNRAIFISTQNKIASVDDSQQEYVAEYVPEYQIEFAIPYQNKGVMIGSEKPTKVTLVGSILGKAPDGDDGIFPIETVRKLLKIKKNEELTTAVARGKINSLGLRDVEDGKKEREKSDIYKMQARAMEIDYPQTSVILRILANFYERESKRDQISSEIEPLQ